jgi:hypothetical protein
MDLVERHSTEDILFDYTLRPYLPAAPTAGRLRSVNLLNLFLGEGPARAKWDELIRGIRGALGVDRTVWGVKLDGDRVLFELYFYFRSLTSASTAPELRSAIPRAICAEDVRRALAPLLRLDVMPPPHVPALMMSVDVDEATLDAGATRLAHLYLQSGLAYDLSPDGLRHTNHYTFFELGEPARLQALVGHLSNGMAHGSVAGGALQRVLIPQLYACRTICLAVKPLADAVYFAGVRTAQLLWFLRAYRWPAAAVAFVERNAADLEHVLWDVGLDFVAEGGDVRVRKTGLYGTL